MASSQEITNSTEVPLSPFAVFQGKGYRTVGFTSIHFTLQADKVCTLTIEQTTASGQWQVSDEFSNDKHITTVVDGVADKVHLQCSVIVKGNFYRVRLANTTASTLAVTRLFAYPKTSVQQSNIDIRRLQKGVDNVSVYGENSDFEFYATPTTNTQAVYSDGTKGTDVVGGWRYTNTATGKINWYCYSSAGSPTDYKVSQLSNMYAVVNNLSVLGLSLAQNPFIIFYTRPTGSGDALWYKSKYFFGSNAHTDVLGVKLLYTGEDPITVHPEITGINRIKLDFKIAESTKPLEDGAEESIWLGSLQTTNNTATVGSFNFDFQEFGVVWEKTPVLLSVEFGKLQVGGEVSTLANRRQSLQTTTIGLAGSFTGTTFDLGENTVFDCLLLASAVTANGNVRIEYSLDGTVWIPDAGITITSTDPHAVVKGVKTSSRYIRVVKTASSGFQGTLSIYLSSCRI